MNDPIMDAFLAVCHEAMRPGTWFCSLLESSPFFGGPEEGGWYGFDVNVIAYQEFADESQARAAAERIKAMAAEMTATARREFGGRMLREWTWLDDRGLDGDWLPEPDGPATYEVVVSDAVPEPVRGSRRYE